LLRKSWFDRVKCERGLKSLRNYTKKWDAKNKLWSAKPLHNWASHGADAFRYAALGAEDASMGDHQKRPRQAIVEDYAYDIFGG
jgi:hypothetical protein